MLTNRQRQALRARSREGLKAFEPRRREVVSRGAWRQAPVQYVEWKSPGVAAVLAFFCAGLGHFYVGKFGRGILFFLVLPACVAVMTLGGMLSILSSGGGVESLNVFVLLVALASLGSHVFQIMDAYQCAEDVNRAAQRWR